MRITELKYAQGGERHRELVSKLSQLGIHRVAHHMANELNLSRSMRPPWQQENMVQENQSRTYTAAIDAIILLVHSPGFAECAAQVCTEATWQCLGMEWWENLHLMHKTYDHNKAGPHANRYEAFLPNPQTLGVDKIRAFGGCRLAQNLHER